MGSDQRSFADCQSAVKRFVADVGNINHDTETIHFQNHLFAKLGKPVVHGFIGGRIGPLDIATVRQRHVTHAQRGEPAEDGEVGMNHMAAFDAHQSGNLTLAMRFENL